MLPGNENNGESPAEDDIVIDIIVIDIEGPIFPLSGDEYYSPDHDGPYFPLKTRLSRVFRSKGVSLAPGNSSTVDVPTPVEPRSIAFKQEETRSKLAHALVAIFAVEVIAGLCSVLFAKWLGSPALGYPSVKDILSVVFTPTVALVGSAVGFYFGSERKKRPNTE